MTTIFQIPLLQTEKGWIGFTMGIRFDKWLESHKNSNKYFSSTQSPAKLCKFEVVSKVLDPVILIPSARDGVTIFAIILTFETASFICCQLEF